VGRPPVKTFEGGITGHPSERGHKRRMAKAQGRKRGLTAVTVGRAIVGSFLKGGGGLGTGDLEEKTRMLISERQKHCKT